jgi:hypothetical protein
MDGKEQIREEQSQGIVVIAFIVCFLAFISIYWAVRPATELLKVRWAGFLVNAIVPLSVTFAILYRSRWHREIVGPARTFYFLLLSSLVLGGVLIALGLMVCFLMFLLNAVSGGFHP